MLQQLTRKERDLAIMMHSSSLLLAFLAPIIFYFFTRKKSAFLMAQSIAAINFHFTLSTILIISIFVPMDLFYFRFSIFIIEFFLIIHAIYSTIKGKLYRYPAIQFFKVPSF